MIRLATKPPTRQQVRRRAREVDRQQQQANEIAAITINAILWQIIMSNGEGDDSVLTVQLDELATVPKGFKLELQQGDGCIMVKATTVKEKSNIVGLDGKSFETERQET